MARTGTHAAHATIERVIRERLSAGLVRSVNVHDDFDHDGQGVFNVVVVVNAAPAGEDRRRLLGLTRHIRSALSEHDIHEFPIVDFMSKMDAQKLGLEAA